MKKILALLLSLGLALSLCACGGKEAASDVEDTTKRSNTMTSPNENDEDSVIGFYKHTTYKHTSGFQAETEEQAAMDDSLQEADLYMYLVVCDDGAAYLDMLGDTEPLAWDDEYFYFPSDDDYATPYIYEDGILTLTDEDGILTLTDGGELEFTKLTEEEQAYYEENGSGNFDVFFGAEVAG